MLSQTWDVFLRHSTQCTVNDIAQLH